MSQPTFGRIIRNNLLILLGAAVVLGLAVKWMDGAAAILFGLFYLGQALANLILALTHLGSGPQETGAAPYFLSLLLVLLIGFGACTGLFVLADGGGSMH
ncbi:hypothetical protein GCM10027594_23680 [Hymenobacter agri]